jgi:hypothetical protein
MHNGRSRGSALSMMGPFFSPSLSLPCFGLFISHGNGGSLELVCECVYVLEARYTVLCSIRTDGQTTCYLEVGTLIVHAMPLADRSSYPHPCLSACVCLSVCMRMPVKQGRILHTTTLYRLEQVLLLEPYI